MPLNEIELAQQLKENSVALNKVERDIADINKAIAVLVDNAMHTLDRCPMRVDIARADNGAIRATVRAEAALALAQKAVDLTIENRVGIAKLAAMTAGGGITGGLVVSIVQYLMQLQ